jgi:hypothetical protein
LVHFSSFNESIVNEALFWILCIGDCGRMEAEISVGFIGKN